jgi:hypothetical protein
MSTAVTSQNSHRSIMSSAGKCERCPFNASIGKRLAPSCATDLVRTRWNRLCPRPDLPRAFVTTSRRSEGVGELQIGKDPVVIRGDDAVVSFQSEAS